MSLFFLIFTSLTITTNCDPRRHDPYDYCDPKLKLCAIPSSHTMCRYPVPGPSRECTRSVNEPLSNSEKLDILSLHNKLRSKVATGTEKISSEPLPPASNMLQMQWDLELEAIAARWANRCFNMTVAKIYDDCRNTKRFKVNQNVGTIGSEGPTIEKDILRVLYRWYTNNKSFIPTTVDMYTNAEELRKAEEFTNLIWADSYAIGCSRVIFQNYLFDGQGGNATLWTFQRIVCNYGPAGNIPGRAIYKRGAPCSNCPGGRNCSTEFPGLCAPLVERTTESTLVTPSFQTSKKPMTGMMMEGLRRAVMHPLPEITYGGATEDIDASEKFLLKPGLYINGHCHCSDINRSGIPVSANEEIADRFEMLRAQLRYVRNVPEPKWNSGRHESYGLKQGDRCYCIRSAAKSSQPLIFTHCATILHLFIYLLVYFVQ